MDSKKWIVTETSVGAPCGSVFDIHAPSGVLAAHIVGCPACSAESDRGTAAIAEARADGTLVDCSNKGNAPTG